ncbi:MAG: hypothetical protein KBD37_06350 [Burkholderiales bacterium]|nr:hypothetical protein [Burkholderiales bacterium]
MKKQFWQTREDGVVHADPEGFVHGYYIYPPNYDESHSEKYELWLIQSDGAFSYDEKAWQFDDLAQAQEAALAKFKAVITPYI